MELLKKAFRKWAPWADFRGQPVGTGAKRGLIVGLMIVTSAILLTIALGIFDWLTATGGEDELPLAIVGLALLLAGLGLPWSWFAIWSARQGTGGAALILLIAAIGILINGVLIGALVGRFAKWRRLRSGERIDSRARKGSH